MKEITLKAPATIANFGPGFDIFALALAEPYDILNLRLNNSGSINITLSGRDEGIPCSVNENSAGIAAAQFLKKTNQTKGIDIKIQKRMRSCSGLGTSGASAASCVYGLDKLFDTGLKKVEIIDIARQGETATGGAAHADNVAGCLLGGFTLVKSYSPLEVERMEIPDIPIVISVKKKFQKTTRELIPAKIGLTEAVEQMSSCAALVKAIISGDLKKIGEAVNTDHISEPVRGRFIPGYFELKNNILKAGAYGCSICGGGSSIFAICEEDKVEDIAEIMQDFSKKEEDHQVIITSASNQGILEINEK